jgi:hypothetical protein
MANILLSVALTRHSRRTGLVYIKLCESKLLLWGAATCTAMMYIIGEVFICYFFGASSVIPRGRGKGCPVRPTE